MEIIRLIVTGPVGAGKSTFVRSVSEIEVVNTDRPATDKTSLIKQKTTIALDFGRLNFGYNTAVHLYGTPGNARFDFMWELLIRRAHAYILLVAANRPSNFYQARRILAFMNQRVQIPMIIGLTHTDCPGAWSKKDVAISLGCFDRQQPPSIFTVNPTQKDSVLNFFCNFSIVADDNYASYPAHSPGSLAPLSASRNSLNSASILPEVSTSLALLRSRYSSEELVKLSR